MTLILKSFLLLVLFAVSLVSFAVYGAKDQHFLELLSHFRVYYLLIQLFCVVGLLLLRSRILLLLAIASTALNLAPMVPYYLPQSINKASTASSLKILQVNVYGPNQDHSKVLKLIQSVNPDIIAVEEVRPHWASLLSTSLKAYRYRLVVPEKTAFGIALFSKLPLTNARVVQFGNPYGRDKRLFASIVADTQIGKQKTTLLVTHSLPPMTGFAVRNSQLADIAKHCQELRSRSVR